MREMHVDFVLLLFLSYRGKWIVFFDSARTFFIVSSADQSLGLSGSNMAVQRLLGIFETFPSATHMQICAEYGIGC